jgi:hypothetical protein
MILPINDFCAELAMRVGPLQRDGETLRALREAGAVYRADTCFEAMADLSDALVGVEQGRLGEDVARTEALRVCRLAVLLWLSVVGEDEEGDN